MAKDRKSFCEWENSYTYVPISSKDLILECKCEKRDNP